MRRKNNMKTRFIHRFFIPRAATILFALFVTVQGVLASVDISNAIIYNPFRFSPYDGFNYFPDYRDDLEVYVYDDGWKKLTYETDYTISTLDSNGEDTNNNVRNKGYYTLIINGCGDYTGQASQTVHVGASGDWQKHKADAFSKIDDTNKVITITSEEELALLAWSFNQTASFRAPYRGWTIRLACDLDLGDYTWTPIGSAEPGGEAGFEAHFDGQGHTIRGVYLERMNSASQFSYFYPQGLFAYVTEGGSVKNLTLTDSEIVGGYTEGVGTIVGYANINTTIQNCHVTSSVNVICLNGVKGKDSGNSYGGIVGYSSADLTGCTSGAHVFRKNGTQGCEAFGGVVGQCVINSYGQFTDCIYYGNLVVADSGTGALIGRLENRNNKTMHCCYTSTVLKGCDGADPSEIMKMEAYDQNSILSANYGGAIIRSYDPNGIEVYPNAMVFDGVVYTLPQYVAVLNGAGTAEVPYLIKTTDDLDLVATCVNNGNHFTGKHFKLCNNLVYDGSAGNYTAIGCWDGSNGSYFDGVFDGDNHSISGIHIQKSGNTDADSYQGVFGWNGANAVVKDLMVSNSTFDAHNSTGAICGSNEGKIENCHVLDGVSVNALVGSTYYHGGITGYNSSTGIVSGCSSIVSMEEIGEGACGRLGGIIGLNEGQMSDCLALGCDIHGTTYQGALVGENQEGTLSHNYYSACHWSNAQDTYTKTTDIGCGGQGEVSADASTDDGAVAALRDGSDNTTAISLLADRADYLLENGFTATAAVSLSGRTLYRDGSWNTLCVPFTLDDFTGSPLEGAEVKTLIGASFDNGTLTLDFSDNLSNIEAGKPYIVRWANGNDIENPVFTGKTFSTSDNPVAITDIITFRGIFLPYNIPSVDKTLLYMGSDNKVYYPNRAMNINAFRAYFELQGGLECGKPIDNGNGINAFVLNFGDETTGIVGTDLNPAYKESGTSSTIPPTWFMLDGRKQNSKPTTKGIYINNGRKFVIK